MQVAQLAKVYAAKTDEELLELATQAHELTYEAEAALKSALARRPIDAAEHFRTREIRDKETYPQTIRIAQTAAEPTRVATFVAEALGVYRSHFWLFIRLVVPAVTIGVFTVFIGRNESREILRHVPRGIEILTHQTELIESWFVEGAQCQSEDEATFRVRVAIGEVWAVQASVGIFLQNSCARLTYRLVVSLR